MRGEYDEQAAEEAACAAVADRADREMDRMERRWEKERAVLTDQIKHMANVVHQAHHQEVAVGWLECTKALCADARKAIGIRDTQKLATT